MIKIKKSEERGKHMKKAKEGGKSRKEGRKEVMEELKERK